MPRRVRDDLGREIYFGPAPRRVVSLVPSETYNLFALGLGECVVGRTRYCVEPADAVAGINDVGGTKDVDIERIMALEPDLILANKEENSRGPLERLASERFRVFVSFPRRVEDAIAHLARLALIFDVRDTAAELVRRGYHVAREAAALDPVSTFVPIWRDPWMTFGERTYGHDVLVKAGFSNVFASRNRLYPLKADLGLAPAWTDEERGERDTRYPRVTFEEIASKVPSAVLLPDEPYEFAAKDKDEFAQLSQRVELICGKDLFWHGAWTIDALPRLRALARRLSPRG